MLACPVPEKGASGTEYPSCTGNACFLHRMPQKMRRVPQEPVFCTARIFRTVGGPLRYRILRMPEKRRALPALNASSDRKEKGMARKMSRNAAASKKITASVPKTHRQTAPQLKDPPQLHTRLHTRPTKNTTNTKHLQHPQSPPPGCPKSPLLKVQSAFWAILAGVELTEGVLFGQAPPRAQKKKPRLNVTSIGTSEKRQLPTLPPGGAVPSALVSLTSLFGMGRGGSSPL